ncbi:MAG: YlbF family regulator [Halanaerobiales bacterium]|nr:YlbF family regulator [Halanaerobiales bacterium]
MTEDKTVITEASNVLAEKLVKTKKYQELESLKKKINKNPDDRKLLKDYQEKTNMIAMMGGINFSDDNQLEQLKEKINDNKTVSAYLKAEEAWEKYLEELFVEIGNELEFDFLGSLGGGCC